MKRKEPYIFLIAGKARHGKDTVAAIIREYYLRNELKVDVLQFSYYLKDYVKRLSSWDGSDDTKADYRGFMQELGTDVIRKEIDSKFFINRMIEDIKVYAYYCDVLTISDVRFPDEIDDIKKSFPNVISIYVNRPNFDSPLKSKEQKHITETALDNYNDFDYKIINDGTIDELKDKVLDIIKKIN